MPRAKKSVKGSNSSKKEAEPKWKYYFGSFRILIGFIFLWPFLDKLFGFGISTAPGKAWINGFSPVAGFLAHGTTGPLASIYQAMASSQLVSWLFMLGLFFVGVTMMLGVGTKLSAIVGTVMLTLMWSAELPMTTNPFMDYHWFYSFALITAALVGSGRFIGLGNWWRSLSFVKKCPILE